MLDIGNYIQKYYATNLSLRKGYVKAFLYDSYEKFQVQQNIRKQSLTRITWSLLFLGSILLICIGFNITYGVEVFSKDEQPFGIPYDEWLGKYWNWMLH